MYFCLFAYLRSLLRSLCPCWPALSPPSGTLGLLCFSLAVSLSVLVSHCPFFLYQHKVLSAPLFYPSSPFSVKCLLSYPCSSCWSRAPSPYFAPVHLPGELPLLTLNIFFSPPANFSAYSSLLWNRTKKTSSKMESGGLKGKPSRTITGSQLQTPGRRHQLTDLNGILLTQQQAQPIGNAFRRELLLSFNGLLFKTTTPKFLLFLYKATFLSFADCTCLWFFASLPVLLLQFLFYSWINPLCP